MYYFLKKCNNFYAGEGHEWYEAIATTTDEKICITINNTIPHRNDKEKIVCVHLLGNEFTQIHEFDYDFTHDFDASLLII